MENENTNTPTPPADPIAALHARLDAQDKTNEAIMNVLQKLTIGAPSPGAAAAPDASAAGTFKKTPPAPIVVEEKAPKSAEDQFLDKIVDRLQARLGLAATGVAAPAAEPGGPCNLCDGTGVNAGGIIGCNRCMGSGVMPGKRLS